MDRKYIDDNHVVVRFLADQLSDSDREAFEAFCLEHPETYRELESTARFKVGLAKLDESRQLAPLLETRSDLRPFVFRHAAVLAGLTVGGAILFGAVSALRIPTMGSTIAEVSGRFREQLPVAANYELIRLRDSAAEVPTVVLPPTPAAIRLRVLPDIENAASYRATLRSEAGAAMRTVASTGKLVPDGEYFVTLFVDSTQLSPGMYEIEVVPEESARNEDGPGLRFIVVPAQ